MQLSKEIKHHKTHIQLQIHPQTSLRAGSLVWVGYRGQAAATASRRAAPPETFNLLTDQMLIDKAHAYFQELAEFVRTEAMEVGPAVFSLSSTKEECTMSVLRRMPTKMHGATGGVLSRPIMTETGREDIASQRMVI